MQVGFSRRCFDRRGQLPREQRTGQADGNQGQEQPGVDCAAGAVSAQSGRRRREGAQRPRDGADSVVPAVGPGGPGVLASKHDLLQGGGRSVVHDVGGQGAGQGHDQQQPERGTGGDDRTGQGDGQEEHRVAAASPDPIGQPTDHETGQAVPAIIAVSTTPASSGPYPRAASSAPKMTAVNPYPAARTP